MPGPVPRLPTRTDGRSRNVDTLSTGITGIVPPRALALFIRSAPARGRMRARLAVSRPHKNHVINAVSAGTLNGQNRSVRLRPVTHGQGPLSAAKVSCEQVVPRERTTGFEPATLALAR